jgi:hypothetical protein
MTSYALVVGINDYPASTGLNQLFGAVADAADFADWALHKDGGGVADANFYFWTHPAPANMTPRLTAYLQNPTHWTFGPPDPTRPPDYTDIANTAFDIAQTARQSAPNRMYVFFAGHGLQTTSLSTQNDTQTCFVTNDFRPQGITQGLIPCDDLRRGLLTAGITEVIMFLDCCRTPVNFNMAAPVIGFRLAPVPDALYGVGRAAKRGAKAYEAPEAAPIRGAFSQVLMQGLRSVRNTNGELTLNDLENYVFAGVDNLLGNGKQYPQFDIEPRNPPYRLIQAPAIGMDLPIVVTFTHLPPGASVQLTAADGQTVGAPIVASPNPVTIHAPAGTLYSLETPDHSLVKTFKHDGPGETHVDL